MPIQHPAFTRVLRLRLKDKHARALRERAYWVNQVWNYCNDLSVKVLRREGLGHFLPQWPGPVLGARATLPVGQLRPLER